MQGIETYIQRFPRPPRLILICLEYLFAGTRHVAMRAVSPSSALSRAIRRPPSKAGSREALCDLLRFQKNSGSGPLCFRGERRVMVSNRLMERSAAREVTATSIMSSEAINRLNNLVRRGRQRSLEKKDRREMGRGAASVPAWTRSELFLRHPVYLDETDQKQPYSPWVRMEDRLQLRSSPFTPCLCPDDVCDESPSSSLLPSRPAPAFSALNPLRIIYLSADSNENVSLSVSLKELLRKQLDVSVSLPSALGLRPSTTVWGLLHRCCSKERC